MTDHDPNLWLAPRDDGIVSAWTASTGDLHFHSLEFDEYGTEVIALEADYDQRTDIKALDWEETHRTWTGDTRQLEFAALDVVVTHFLDREYSVTIAASELSIFCNDYDVPFLAAHLPDEPPPDVVAEADDDGHTELGDF